MAVVTITKENFENEVLKSDKPVLLDFWATWCGPCRMVSPIVDEIANERDDIKVGKINVDEQGELSMQFRIVSIPTLIVMKNGEVANKAVGAMPLVLHGGTGIPDDQITKAISLGVAKINVNTECQLVFAEATRKYIEEGKDQVGKGFDPRKLLLPGYEAIMAKVEEKVNLFGSVNKA